MIQLKIITLNGVFLDKEVFEVHVPTTAGPIAINGGHAPLVGAIKAGVLSIISKRGDRESQIEDIAVYDGTVEVLNNELTILVDDVDVPDEISQAEAEKALARAKEISSKSKDAVELAEAQTMMDRSAVRLELASRKKRHR